MTKIYGHRGAKGTYPENTLLSFQKAIEFGVDGLELDVHLTKDGEVVVIHDETLDRTTSGHGWIKDLTLADIKKVSAGSPYFHFTLYDKGWDREQVPTLQEVLELIASSPIELNIELKTYVIPYKGIEKKVHDIVEQYGNGRKVVYSSFHLPTLLRMKKVDPKANIAWLLNDGVSLPEDYINTLGLEALHLHKGIVIPDKKTFQQINQFIQKGQFNIPKEVSKFILKKMDDHYPHYLEKIYHKIRVWTVNDSNEMQRFMKLNVDAIVTDYPEVAVGLRRASKL